MNISAVKFFDPAGKRIFPDFKIDVRPLGEIFRESGVNSRLISPDSLRAPAGGFARRLQAVAGPESGNIRGLDRDIQSVRDARRKVVGSISERVQDLVHERNGLLTDLRDPARSAAARARIGMLDMHIAKLSEVRDRAAAVRIPANLSPEQAQVMTRSFAGLDRVVDNLANPTRVAQAQGEKVLLFGRLADPSPVDSMTLRNQANTVANLAGRIMDLVNEKNGLIADLRNPGRAAAAQVRFRMIDAQIGELSKLNQRLTNFQPPAGVLGTKADHDLATAIYQIYEASNDLSNPSKRTKAVGRIEQAFARLQRP